MTAIYLNAQLEFAATYSRRSRFQARVKQSSPCRPSECCHPSSRGSDLRAGEQPLETQATTPQLITCVPQPLSRANLAPEASRRATCLERKLNHNCSDPGWGPDMPRSNIVLAIRAPFPVGGVLMYFTSENMWRWVEHRHSFSLRLRSPVGAVTVRDPPLASFRSIGVEERLKGFGFQDIP